MLCSLWLLGVILSFVALLLLVKAGWHRHQISEIFNAADIAGMSDGRCSNELLANVANERKRLRSQVSFSLSTACVIAGLAVIALYNA